MTNAEYEKALYIISRIDQYLLCVYNRINPFPKTL